MNSKIVSETVDLALQSLQACKVVLIDLVSEIECGMFLLQGYLHIHHRLLLVV
jgi:hypothetical protein